MVPVEKRVKKTEAGILIERLKRVPCADCAQRYSSDLMCFDRIASRGPSLGPIELMRSTVSISIEARKCDVICLKCLSIRKAGRRANPNYDHERQAAKLAPRLHVRPEAVRE